MLNVDFTVSSPDIYDLTSQVDGVNKIFITPNPFSSVLRVFLDGQLMKDPEDYSVTVPNTITFTFAPTVHPLDGASKLRIETLP